ncbi:MAG: hypothetical protein EHM79_11055 [Geobacter sp.]|nr:MAG: hypothetical protein EHM79_11055 [Geobacter sp.]
MKREQTKIIQIVEDDIPMAATRIGRIVRIEKSGIVLVDFSGNNSGPIAARTTTSSRVENLRKGNPAGREVLLAFENNDPKFPIIIDTMYSLIEEIAEPTTVVVEAEEPQEVTVDGKSISFEAENEIVLKCGKASITLTKAGKILIKGDYVLSQSSGENRIRGGSVSVN